MKLQTSGVLGTSYAIAKLAPKRVAGPQSNFKELGGGLQIELPRYRNEKENLSRFPLQTIRKL